METVFMNGKTHQLVGLTGSVLVATALYKTGLGIPASIATIAFSTLGSYAPDRDHTGSTAGKKMALVSYPISGLCKLFAWMHRKTKIKLFKHISEMFQHRGIFHAPLFWLAIFIPLLIFVPPAITYESIRQLAIGGIIGFATGVALHLAADMLNPTGIPLFMPISNKKFRLARIVTGSRAETGFKIVVILTLLISCLIGFITVFGV